MSEVLRRIVELLQSTKDSGTRAVLAPVGFEKAHGRASKKRVREQSA
jgi:hypothetical protein